VLGLDDAKAFVKDILDSARLDPKGKAGYFPFTEEAVETIVSQIVTITPRKIIDSMQQILEEVRLVGCNPAKGAVTSDVLNKHDVLNEVFGSP
jgi:hypothetical protein